MKIDSENCSNSNIGEVKIGDQVIANFSNEELNSKDQNQIAKDILNKILKNKS